MDFFLTCCPLLFLAHFPNQSPYTYSFPKQRFLKKSSNESYRVHFAGDMMVSLLLSQCHAYKAIAIECLGMISLVINLFKPRAF